MSKNDGGPALPTCSKRCGRVPTHRVRDGASEFVHYRCEQCAQQEAAHGWIIEPMLAAREKKP